MKEIVFVTTNKGKIASAQKYFSNVKVIPYNADLIEPRSEDIQEIATQKVLQAYKIAQKPCIALDAGFFIEELNGFPKAYVNHMLNTIGIKGVLKLMKGVENRKCEFKSVLAYNDGNNIKYFENKSPGIISNEIRGNDDTEKWSDLWYIFIPEKFSKTLAEFSKEDHDHYDDIKDTSCIKKFGDWYKEK